MYMVLKTQSSQRSKNKRCNSLPFPIPSPIPHVTTEYFLRCLSRKRCVYISAYIRNPYFLI